MKLSLLSPHHTMLMKISSHVKSIQPKVKPQSKSMIMHDEQTFFSYLTSFLHLVAFVCLIALSNKLDNLKQRRSHLLALIFCTGYSLILVVDKLWPRGYKTFFVLNSSEHKISTAHKN